MQKPQLTLHTLAFLDLVLDLPLGLPLDFPFLFLLLPALLLDERVAFYRKTSILNSLMIHILTSLLQIYSYLKTITHHKNIQVLVHVPL